MNTTKIHLPINLPVAKITPTSAGINTSFEFIPKCIEIKDGLLNPLSYDSFVEDLQLAINQISYDKAEKIIDRLQKSIDDGSATDKDCAIFRVNCAMMSALVNCSKDSDDLLIDMIASFFCNGTFSGMTTEKARKRVNGFIKSLDADIETYLKTEKVEMSDKMRKSYTDAKMELIACLNDACTSNYLLSAFNVSLSEKHILGLYKMSCTSMSNNNRFVAVGDSSRAVIEFKKALAELILGKMKISLVNPPKDDTDEWD